jgi:EAL domain-containing protein (putative c-di-GMP-specific phosphodiesterase class I)/GGDEF domain-containing protein
MIQKKTQTSETGTVLRLETLDGKPVAEGSRPDPGELGSTLRRELLAAIGLDQKAQLLVFRISDYALLVDTFGTSFGAAAEEAVLEQLRGKIRKREPTQRIRDGEFGIVGRGIQSVDALNAMATRMAEGGTGHYEINGVTCRLKIDVGAAACPEDSSDPEVLLRFARFALGDRDAEPGGCRSFSQQRFERRKASFLIEADMEQALDEGRFQLVYQPQYSMTSGRIAGVEALARMYSREGREISPNDFIPLAEDNGFIVRLGRWVIEEACRQLAGWRKEGCEVPRISVNLSPKQLYDPELVATVEKAVYQNDLHYGHLEIEITERCVVDDSRVVTEVLHALRARGVRIAIDDFGTGYSSFAYLAGQPLDMIKVDRSFLSRVGDDFRTRQVVAGMIRMAHELGMDLLVEGVENEEQEQFLRDQGCELAQGFALARPQTPDRIAGLFMEQQLALALA